jgi:hypothetical protein
VKNITVSVPAEVYHAARIRAAEAETSVSGLVAAYLRSLSGADAEFERLAELQRQTTAGIGDFSARDRLDRESVHDRALR